MVDVQTAFSAGMAALQSAALEIIAAVLPYAVRILGALIVVRLGINLFRGVTGSATGGGSYSGSSSDW